MRLEIAGIPKDKIVYERDELSAVDKLKLDGVETIFILHDLYSIELKDAIKHKVEIMIKSSEEKKEEEKGE